MWGLTVEEAMGPPFEVWPDNLQAVNAFVAMSTQWNVGPAGVIGLNYASLPAVYDSIGVAVEERPDVFDGLRQMEDAALEVLRAKK